MKCLCFTDNLILEKLAIYSKDSRNVFGDTDKTMENLEGKLFLKCLLLSLVSCFTEKTIAVFIYTCISSSLHLFWPIFRI